MPKFAGCFIQISGWFGHLVSLVQSRFERIYQSANNLGSCLGKSPLFCAVVAKKGRLLRLESSCLIIRELGLLVLSLAHLAVKRVSGCDLVQKSRFVSQFFAK